MIKYLKVIIALSFLGGCQSVEQKTWKEQDRLLVIEAEQGDYDPEKSGWKHETTFPGFKGDGYVIWRGRGDWGPEKREYDSIADSQNIISYTFLIDNPGTYYVKVLNYHLKEDGDNDVWTSVDKGAWGKTYDWQVKEWTIDERGEWAKYNFNKGKHMVQLAGRSQGFAVDQIIIFNEIIKDKFIQPLKE